MELRDILTPERTVQGLQVDSKKRVLEKLSEITDHALKELSAADVFQCLVTRERLGSTGIGHGVALPHGRLPDIHETVGAFVTLEKAVSFDAVDNEDVDLIFVLLVPEDATDEHLQVLALLAQLFSQEENRQILRQTEDSLSLYKTFIQLTEDKSSWLNPDIHPQ